MTRRARRRGLTALAASAVLAAGHALTLDQHQAPGHAEHPSHHATLAAVPPPAGAPVAALRVAHAYTLAARNWSATSFRGTYRRQRALAAGALASQLAAHTPTRHQLQQLRTDASSCLAIVVDTDARFAGNAVDVGVRLAELHELGGHRIRTRRWYALRLRHHGAWRVTSFTVIRGRS
jgi:hypothetical protein